MKPYPPDFLAYLLNHAAELISRDFEPTYKQRYGMLRAEWRVLFHLGHSGDLTAKEICNRSAMHKTKVSRAVRALEAKRYLHRHKLELDRRSECLSLTDIGRKVFERVDQSAKNYDNMIAEAVGAQNLESTKALLKKLIAYHSLDTD